MHGPHCCFTLVRLDSTSKNKLPLQINEAIDYNKDGHTDLIIEFNTKTLATKLTPLSPDDQRVQRSFEIKDAKSVRILLKNPIDL